MQYDPKFATSPIFVTGKDYEFPIDHELISLVESDPFHGYDSETVVAHLTKLNDIATLFAHDEKIRYYYIRNLELISQVWGRLMQLFNALPDHPLKKNEYLIFL